MNNKYKQIFIDKVKAKSNDLQSSCNGNKQSTDKPCNDKGSEVCKSSGVVGKKIGRAHV